MQYYNPSYQEMKEIFASNKKPVIFYNISKEEVENKDFKNLDKLFNDLKKIGKKARGTLALTCGGYDDISDELFEIQVVREFIQELSHRHTHLLYYIFKEFEAEAWIICCLADEVTSVARYEGEKLNAHQLFEKYGFNPPQLKSHIVFRDGKLSKLLRAVASHGLINKDARGGKKVAIEYAMKFDGTLEILGNIGIRQNEVKDIMGW